MIIFLNPKVHIPSDNFQLKKRFPYNHKYDHSEIQLRSKLMPLIIPSHHFSPVPIYKGNNQCEMHQILTWVSLCPSILFAYYVSSSVFFSQLYDWQNMKKTGFPMGRSFKVSELTVDVASCFKYPHLQECSRTTKLVILKIKCSYGFGVCKWGGTMALHWSPEVASMQTDHQKCNDVTQTYISLGSNWAKKSH